MVSASTEEVGGQAASCRTIQELLESYTPAPFTDHSSPPAATVSMAQRSGAVMDGVARNLGTVAVDGERNCNSVSQGEFSVSLLERLQLPCGLSPSVLPFAPQMIKQDSGSGGVSQCPAGPAGMPDTVSNADASSAGSRVAEMVCPRSGERAPKAPGLRPRLPAQPSPAGQDTSVSETPSSEWWNGRNSLSELVGDEAVSSSSNGIDVASKLSPPLLDPFAALARIATTTTCSAASTHEDTVRHDDVGRVPRVILEQPAAFPFLPTPSNHVIPASVDTDGESLATEQEGEQHSKLGHGPFGLPRPLRSIHSCQPGSQGGVWPVRPNTLGTAGGAEQLLQRVLHAMNTEAVNPTIWSAEQPHLLSDVGRLGGRSEGGFTLNGVRAENSEGYEQLLGLCAPHISPAVSAWPLLQAGVASPSTGCVGGSLLGGGGILPQGATTGEAFPTKTSLWDSPVTREGLPSPHLPLLLQAELLRSQELLNGGGAAGGMVGGELEELMARVRQLHGAPGISNLALNGQAHSHAGIPQSHEFPLFCHQGLPVTDACALVSHAGETCANTAFGSVKPAAAAPGKKVRKDAGFAEPGQKKKVRKPKSKDTSRTESPIPGSPKVAPRKKREGTPTSRSGDDNGESTSATSLANDLHAMAVLANMTEEEAAELEAEAIRRQSNRSRNCPAEVINAVDFTGELIKFAKVIGLHYHPKQNRWLAWRSQKGSKKVFKSFSTKKFGISGARLMALRWRLGHGVGPDDGQDALSDSNEMDETVQSPSGDERDNSSAEPAVGCDGASDTTGTGGAVTSESPTPVSGQEMVGDATSTERGAGMSDEMSESTATGGSASSESSTPANDLEVFCDASFPEKRGKGVASGPCSGEYELKWQSFEKKEALFPVGPAARADHQCSDAASRLSAPLSSLLSDRLGLLLGSITPAEDLTESDRSRLAVLSLQGQGEDRIFSTPLADIVEGSASCRHDPQDNELCSR